VFDLRTRTGGNIGTFDLALKLDGGAVSDINLRTGNVGTFYEEGLVDLKCHSSLKFIFRKIHFSENIYYIKSNNENSMKKFPRITEI